jgi:ataxia telangiectasia mutated family protein
VPARTSAAVAEIVAHVPARTFLPLVYQLASRLSQRQADESPESDGGRFQRALQALLLATATRLPQQSLWTLIALSNGARLPADQGSKSFHVVDQDKVDAAHALLRRLRVGDDGARLGAILDEMTQLADAYIDFASSAIPKGADNKPQIDVSGLLLGVPELPRVAVPTLQLELSEEEERSGLFVHVTGFPTTFRTVGGINVPKIIDCIGADGRLYRQLVKGKDDLRQDMVMQQTFAMCNALLRGATETRRRCLRIGTYRVVPLTPGAGVLEWCNNTMPLGSWIEGDRGLIGARHRYRPNDMQRADARAALEQCAPSLRRREFDRICARYLPVFHYFFLESFPSAAEWFGARLAYTRSVAAASIVGNVVGLGDRHSQNILVNVATAELTHIDLGVAFEQGLTLRVPEIVPFRLTREIVDGMGAIGVAGTFTRCCEATASVLKRNQTLILAVLEVLLHDPLYRWALSVDDALALQKAEVAAADDKELEGALEFEAGAAANAAEPNKDAARALLRCRQKLQCVVGGEVLSVEGYVSQLIAEARDEDRLSQMFGGWGPFS